MSRDVHLIDKSGEDDTVWSLENLSTLKWLEGHVSGAERAMAYLLEKSSKVFLDGDTKKAEILRDIAGEIKTKVVPELKSKILHHQEYYPAKVEPDG